MKVFCIGTALVVGITLVVLIVAHIKEVCDTATVFLDHY